MQETVRSTSVPSSSGIGQVARPVFHKTSGRVTEIAGRRRGSSASSALATSRLFMLPVVTRRWVSDDNRCLVRRQWIQCLIIQYYWVIFFSEHWSVAYINMRPLVHAVLWASSPIQTSQNYSLWIFVMIFLWIRSLDLHNLVIVWTWSIYLKAYKYMLTNLLVQITMLLPLLENRPKVLAKGTSYASVPAATAADIFDQRCSKVRGLVPS